MIKKIKLITCGEISKEELKGMDDDVALHKKTVGEIKEAIWKKYNY